MNKRNSIFAEAIGNCGATFLRPDSTPLLCYRAAKKFVEEYEREEHEQRRAVPDPAQRAFPPDWSDDKQKAYLQLASAVFEGGDFVKIQAAAKSFVEICKREEREKKPKPDRAWSPAKHQAYNILLDDFLTYAHYDEIVADARRLAAVCEREEREQRHEAQKREEPKTGGVYRDIFGNIYLIYGVHDSSTDGEQVKKPIVVMTKMDNISPFTVPLEDFMNPTFKKYN